MNRHIYMILFIFFCFFSSGARAELQPNLENFSKWPVLHEGRVKPMESFARAVLYDVSGDTSVRGISAMTWLTNSLFDPASTISDPFITIEPNTLLDLPPRDNGLYSMNEAMTALNPHQELIQKLEQKDREDLSLQQRQLLAAYTSVSIYNQVIQSFSAVLPLKGHDKNFMRGGGSGAQRELILAGGMGNGLMKFIPHDNPSIPFLSLWQAIDYDTGADITEKIEAMARAWNDKDYAQWDVLAVDVMKILQAHKDREMSFHLEHFYVTWHPMIWVMGIYALAICFLAVPLLNRYGLAMASLGCVMHVATLVLRSIILMRPPTGTLYETLLFGSAIIVIVGLIVAYRARNDHFFIMIALASALALLFVSRGFIQGDSLNVLVAVLNTNFWLSTHVTTIIIGYGFCVLTALCAHGALVQEKGQAERLMIPMSLLALLFTSIGTLLGGIWADQSWGRFWGWDPKENGALLIVLWLIWALHGRLSGHLRGRVFAAVLAGTNIMVALTWFGVNLLGVGLHSYGFISGIAYGLTAFILGQILVILGLYYYPRFWRKARP